MKKQNEADGLRASYDRLAGEYARRLFDEPGRKPLDRALLAGSRGKPGGWDRCTIWGADPGTSHATCAASGQRCSAWTSLTAWSSRHGA